MLAQFKSKAGVHTTHFVTTNCFAGEAVQPLLERVARDYPAALFYPFRISSEEFTGPAEKGRAHKVRQELNRSSSTRLMEQWCENLERLTYPLHRWGNHKEGWAAQATPHSHTIRYTTHSLSAHFLLTIGSLWLQIGDLLACNQTERAVEMFNRAFKDLFDVKETQGSSLHKTFAEKHASQVLKLFGKCGSKISEMSQSDFNKASGALTAALKKDYETHKTGLINMSGDQPLSLFSPWMAKFSAADGEFLEVPGQYSGLMMPQPQHHVMVRVACASSAESTCAPGDGIWGTDVDPPIFAAP